jgi:type VI protein secretion system component VasF
MKLIRRILVVTVLLSGSLAPALSAQEPSTTEQQGEFVPAGDLPQREQIPAAPLLIGAYAFVMLAFFGYVVSVSRRLGSVKADVARLEAEIKRGSRA